MAKNNPARKARLKTRHQADAEEGQRICAALKAQGNQCSVCAHKGKRPPDILVCELDSDFQGYAPVKPDFVCRRFKNQD